MTYLLDVSTLLAWLWSHHEHNRHVLRWHEGKRTAICPITEIGFLRISSQPAFAASIEDARTMLADWHQKVNPVQVPCDISALIGSPAPTSGKTTDFYLANLAERHGMQLATLDKSIHHKAVFVIPT